MLQSRHCTPGACPLSLNIVVFVRVFSAILGSIAARRKLLLAICYDQFSAACPSSRAPSHVYHLLGTNITREPVMTTAHDNIGDTPYPARPSALVGPTTGGGNKRKSLHDILTESTSGRIQSRFTRPPKCDDGVQTRSDETSISSSGEGGTDDACPPKPSKRPRHLPSSINEQQAIDKSQAASNSAANVFVSEGLPQLPKAGGQDDHDIDRQTRVQTEVPAPAPHIIGGKREGYLVWDDYFMSVAFLSAMRSKDPSTQVGACIVNQEKRIVGIGYNGFPTGCSDDDLPWNREADDELDTKYPYVCHAEMNAILNKNIADVKGCLIYVALFPCNECAKLIIQSGITEVVYLSDKYHHLTSMKASRRLFELAGLKCRQYVPKQDRVVIDFSTVPR